MISPNPNPNQDIEQHQPTPPCSTNLNFKFLIEFRALAPFSHTCTFVTPPHPPNSNYQTPYSPVPLALIPRFFFAAEEGPEPKYILQQNLLTSTRESMASHYLCNQRPPRDVVSLDKGAGPKRTLHPKPNTNPNLTLSNGEESKPTNREGQAEIPRLRGRRLLTVLTCLSWRALS